MKKSFAEQINELRGRLIDCPLSNSKIAGNQEHFSARWLRKFIVADKSSPEIRCLDALRLRLDEIERTKNDEK